MWYAVIVSSPIKLEPGNTITPIVFPAGEVQLEYTQEDVSGSSISG